MVRLLSGLAYLALATQSIHAASIPDASNDALSTLEERTPLAADNLASSNALERRKGGGGRGGGSSGGSSSGSSSSGSGGRTSTSGGSTRSGSGPTRSYGSGGGYYGGGASTPYNSGGRSPKGLIAGAVIAPVAIVAIMPGLWLYGAYPYYYNNPYRFYNRTATNRTRSNDNDRRFVSVVLRQEQQGANETLPVICLCGEGQVCGCDENDDQTYINQLVGDGDYAKLNKSLVTVSDVNGTTTLVLNGTLPPGTTAPGGTDGAASALGVGQYAGYWALGLTVLYAVFV